MYFFCPVVVVVVVVVVVIVALKKSPSKRGKGWRPGRGLSIAEAPPGVEEGAGLASDKPGTCSLNMEFNTEYCITQLTLLFFHTQAPLILPMVH